MNKNFCPIIITIIVSFFLNDSIKANDNMPLDSTLQRIKAITNIQTKFLALIDYKNKVANVLPDLSLTIAQEMLTTSQIQKADSNILKSYNELSNAYIIKNNFAEALKQFTLMLELATKLNDYLNQISANIGIGYIYKITGELGNNPKEWDKAKVYNERALAICRIYHIDNMEAYVLNEMAIQYDLEKMHIKAIQIYAEAIVVLNKQHRFPQQIMMYINMGISLKNNKQLEESLQAFLRAAHLTDSLKMPVEKVYVLDNMANLYYEMGKFALAEQTGLNAISKANSLNLDLIRQDMYEMLIKLYAKQKRYENAFEYSGKLSVVKDSIFNTEKSQQLKELQTKFETGIKDKTIGTQTALLAFNKTQNVYLFIAVTLLLLIAFIIFISLRRTIKLNKKITLQQIKLIRQQQELQQVNNIKDRLFSVIGHDLRTPVNSLISFTMLLENGNISSEKMMVYTHELQRNLGYTAGLLENLLNFAKSQMGGFTAYLESITLTDVINDSMLLLLPLASAKKILLQNSVAATVKVSGDINMTSLVIRNLINNAIKFSYEGGEINLFSYAKDGVINLVVKDNGTGIKDELVQAFNIDIKNLQPLESTPGTQHEKGTGLGLLLCKTFTELMQGSISLQSTKGKGSSFIVAFKEPV